MTATATEKPVRVQPPAAGGQPAPVAGLLDIRDNQAFVRASGYQVSAGDIAVPQSLIRQYGLRPGDLVEGTARLPRQDGPSSPGRQNGSGPRQNRSRGGLRMLAGVDTVNGRPPGDAGQRPRFDQLTPLFPQERLRLDAGSSTPTARIIDLVSPIGKGQRGLIVAPPKAGKTMVLQALAAAVTAGHPEVHLMVVLVGERPEEVTEMQRTVRGEVIYSTFDQPAADHIMVAELAAERAKRLAEMGGDVVMLLDSLTRLARAYNLTAPSSSRILTGGVATSALQGPRRFLGAARNTEEGGSLTILSSALVETGSQMDNVFFEEFKGTGNMELRLRRDLAEKRLFPAVDVAASSTRRDDLLMAADEHAAVTRLRRALSGLDPQQALDLLLARTRGTATNPELLLQVQRSA